VKDAKKQLKRHIKNAEATLSDLSMTVDLVESERDRFGHIDDGELYDRRTFVQTARERIQKCKREMSSETVKSKTMADERALAARRVGDMGARTQAEQETTEFVIDTRAQAQMMMNQQDEALDDLDVAVNRVGVMAGEIHEEIGHQNKMLTELDEDLADAEEKLGMVMGKLAKLLKTKNKCQLGTILILCLIVLILFFLVIYT
jgi:syntaxin 6